jgi:peptide/nickel transport system ATP-binding protein
LAIEKCKTEVPPLEPVGLDHRSACWRSADVPPISQIASEETAVAVHR